MFPGPLHEEMPSMGHPHLARAGPWKRAIARENIQKHFRGPKKRTPVTRSGLDLPEEICTDYGHGDSEPPEHREAYERVNLRCPG